MILCSGLILEQRYLFVYILHTQMLLFFLRVEILKIKMIDLHVGI